MCTSSCRSDNLYNYMRLSLSLLLMSVLGLASCADQIQGPTGNGNDDAVLPQGRIVANLMDLDMGDEVADILLLDSTGAELANLGRGVCWSTGKNTIAYALITSFDQSGGEIWVANNNGANRRKLASITRPGSRLSLPPVVSGNGSVVAYVVRDSLGNFTNDYKLHVVDVATKSDRMLEGELARETMMALSPDGSKLAAFIAVSSQEKRLVIYNTSTGASNHVLTDVITGNDLSSTIQWSPSGEKLLFTTKVDGEIVINLMNADGSNLQILGKGLAPTWSADGTALAWTALDGSSSGDIFYTRDFGLTLERLTTSTRSETHPEFSPDGKKLLYTEWLDDALESRAILREITIDSKAVRTILEPAHFGYWLR